LLNRIIVAPLTTTIRRIPTAVLLDPATDEVLQRCVVALDNLQLLPVGLLTERIGTLRDERLREVEQAIHFALELRN
jgi:mRNA interferase MazF